MRRATRAALAALLIALALATPAVAGASRPPEPRVPGFSPDGRVEPAAAQASIARIWEELDRELSARSGPAAPGVSSDADVLPQAEEFYHRLMSAPPAQGPQESAAELGLDLRDDARLDSAVSGAILDLALKYSGVPYRWAGAGPEGLDCSGLVVKAAADGGRRLPHSAVTLYGLGQAVSDDDVRSGDLVFFRDTYKPGISHVGVFVGGTRFLHASSSAGKVTLGDLARPYFRQRYAGARRLRLTRELPARPQPKVERPTGRRLVAPFRLGAS